MDFLELTSSEELLLFEAVSNVSSDVPIVQSEPTSFDLLTICKTLITT
jgi:hypothetical protein